VRRRWFIGAVVVGIAAIAIAAVISRVRDDNGSKTLTTAEWADAVCSDLSTWKTSITLLASVSGGTLTKSSLQQKLGDAKTATDTLVSELKALGKPNLAAGQQLQQQLERSADALSQSYQALATSAQEALSARSPATFLQGLAKLGPRFQQLLDQLQSTVHDLQSSNVAAGAKSELQQSFASSSSCQSLSSGNG
jgi:hypothetical protein